ncbi:protein mab-21-like 3 [Protopterus annectens]|uniref:protein mab-21-like 3 n=1 Tax=Protopterus annectens TaxID=7888 RepID=UPI001CFB4155|nr:protein mab-21-like 3 [Protopterus annectens]
MCAYSSQQVHRRRLQGDTLSKFIHTEVNISRDETKKAVEYVVKKVEAILEKVCARDPRFGSAFLRSGSYREKLQVSDSNEFDFLVPLEYLPGLNFYAYSYCTQDRLLDESYIEVTCNPSPSNTVKAASQPSWERKDVADPFPDMFLLKPDKIMSTFKKEVNNALDLLNQTDSVYVRRRYQGNPAVTFTVKFGREEIDVDLVPFIRNPFPSWPIAWPRPYQRWPSAIKMEEIRKIGVDLVAKHPTFWRFSFSRVERFLLEDIDSDRGRRKDTLRILKKVRLDRWKPQFGKLLVSYHLKTILFWACEKYPNAHDWSDLVVSFERLLDDLIMSLSKGHLSHYFLGRQVNLFKSDAESQMRLTDLYKEVNAFKCDAEHFLST